MAYSTSMDISQTIYFMQLRTVYGTRTIRNTNGKPPNHIPVVMLNRPGGVEPMLSNSRYRMQ